MAEDALAVARHERRHLGDLPLVVRHSQAEGLERDVLVACPGKGRLNL